MRKILTLAFILFVTVSYSQTKLVPFKIGEDSVFALKIQDEYSASTDTIIGVPYRFFLIGENNKTVTNEQIPIPFSQLILFKGKWDLESYIIEKKNYKRL